MNNKYEVVEVKAKGDRSIINRVTLSNTGENKWHFGLIYCYGAACGCDPADEETVFTSRNLALFNGLQELINNHEEALSEPKDGLGNYNRVYIKRIIARAKQLQHDLKLK